MLLGCITDHLRPRGAKGAVQAVAARPSRFKLRSGPPPPPTLTIICYHHSHHHHHHTVPYLQCRAYVYTPYSHACMCAFKTAPSVQVHSQHPPLQQQPFPAVSATVLHFLYTHTHTVSAHQLGIAIKVSIMVLFPAVLQNPALLSIRIQNPPLPPTCIPMALVRRSRHVMRYSNDPLRLN